MNKIEAGGAPETRLSLGVALLLCYHPSCFLRLYCGANMSVQCKITEYKVSPPATLICDSHEFVVLE